MSQFDTTFETQQNETTYSGYGGFWLRFVASFIDGIVLNVVSMAIIFPLLKMFGIDMGSMVMDPEAMATAADPEAMMQQMMQQWMDFYKVAVPIMLLLQVLYFAGMESSSKQATLGKMALGLKVVDVEGNRISFLRGVGRFFAKFLSYFTLLIGFIMAGFTAKKQALHDMVASTLVVKK